MYIYQKRIESCSLKSSGDPELRTSGANTEGLKIKTTNRISKNPLEAAHYGHSLGTELARHRQRLLPLQCACRGQRAAAATASLTALRRAAARACERDVVHVRTHAAGGAIDSPLRTRRTPFFITPSVTGALLSLRRELTLWWEVRA